MGQIIFRFIPNTWYMSFKNNIVGGDGEGKDIEEVK